MIITATIIETIYYILKKIGEADKIKIIKLIYLADKYHLIHYGRTITNDDYYAMEYGPVGTTLKDILSIEQNNIPVMEEERRYLNISVMEEERRYFNSLIERAGQHSFRVVNDRDVPLDMLSESDREALDFVINNFGRMSTWELVDYTHRYPEWSQYKSLFESNLTRRKRIRTDELLSTIENDPLAMPEEHIKESERIIKGDFD